jgi:hypothetical protein
MKRELTKLVNNGLIVERRLGKMLEIKTGPTFQDARDSFRETLQSWEHIIDKVTDLFMRIQKTTQAEAMATVLLASDMISRKKGEKPSECEILDEVLTWKVKRRPPLEKTEVASTIRNLAALNWLSVTPCPDLPVPSEGVLDF